MPSRGWSKTSEPEEAKSYDRIIETSADRNTFIDWLRRQTPPYRVTAKPGGIRSLAQNRLQGLWINEIAKQWHESREHVRCYCKLHFGIPILRRHETMKAKYDALLKPLPYETKIALMGDPMPLPVTSIMTLDEMTEYLDKVYRHFTKQGMTLTDPALLEEQAMKDVFKHFPSAKLHRVTEKSKANT